MKFVCDRCQTKYSIADDRVRGKVLKVKCKTCSNLITVREARRPSAGMAPLGATPGSGVATAPPSSVSDSERTVLAPQAAEVPIAARRPSSVIASLGAARAEAHPPQAQEAPDDGLAWYMALDGKRTGPFSRKQIVDKVVALPRDADLHVWNETLGSWKPPTEVPAIAADLVARRKGPPPPPGTPRRPTPMPPPLPMGPPPSGAPRIATPASVARPAHAPAHSSSVSSPAGDHGPAVAPPPGRPSAPHAPIGGALAAAAHLPSPGGSGGLGHKLPPATGSASRPVATISGGAALALATDASPAADAASLLETPAPLPGGLHAHAHAHAGAAGTNGFGAHASGVHRATGAHGTVSTSGVRSSSDVMQMLNLAGTAPATAAAPAPRIMTAAEAAAGWGGIEAPAPRGRSTRLVIALLGIVAVICGVVTFSLTRKPKAPPPVVVKPAVSDPLAAVVDKLAGEGTSPEKVEPPPPTTAPEPIPAAPTPSASSRGKSTKGRGGRTPAGRATAAAPSAMVASAAGAAPPAEDANAARFRDNTKQLNVTPQPAAVRPPPSQADITRVINNNRNGIKNCYQRALLRDSSLTHGKITVELSIGISGHVKRVAVNGPAQFRALEPCIKDVTSRWAFPQASEEYGTEFAYVFQGNE
jgi:predicted Zn finger-like uncharacterized protein